MKKLKNVEGSLKMDNAGQNNASISIFYFGLIFLPTILYMLKCCLEICYNRPYIQYDDPQPVSNIVINNNLPSTKISTNTSKRKITTKTKEKILRKEFGVVKLQNTAQTSDQIKDTAQKALMKLGFKASDAKSMIRKLCINKVYDNENTLIQDCFKK